MRSRKEMRGSRYACALVLAAIGVGIGACGCSGGSSPAPHARVSHAAGIATAEAAAHISPTSVPPAPVETTADKDDDNDIGAPADDANNYQALDYKQPASAIYRRAIAGLVERYYHAARAEDGAAACSMLDSTYAEAVPEDYGQHPPGPDYAQGKTCAAVLKLIFRHFHPQLALEVPKLEVARVLLVEHHGVAVLRFGSLPGRQIAIGWEGKRWRIAALLDSQLP